MTSNRDRINPIASPTHALGLVVFLTIAAAVSASADPIKELRLPAKQASADEIKFLYEYVVAIHRLIAAAPGEKQKPAVVTVLDLLGDEVLTKELRSESGGPPVTLLDAALTREGVLVLSTSIAQGSSYGRIVEYDLSSGRLVRDFPTSPLPCSYIATDEANSIWCMGIDVAQPLASGYNLVAKFTLEGEFRGVVGRNTGLLAEPITSWPNPGPRRPALIAESGSVAAWLPRGNTLLEWSVDGKPLARFRNGALMNLGPMSLDGDRVLGMFLLQDDANQDGPRGFFDWSETSNTWVPLTAASETVPAGLRLVGADKICAVFWNQETKALQWYRLPE